MKINIDKHEYDITKFADGFSIMLKGIISFSKGSLWLIIGLWSICLVMGQVTWRVMDSIYNKKKKKKNRGEI